MITDPFAVAIEISIFYILLLLLTKIVITVKLIRIIQANNASNNASNKASNKASVSVSLSAYARSDIEDAMIFFIFALIFVHIFYIQSLLCGCLPLLMILLEIMELLYPLYREIIIILRAIFWPSE